MSQLTKAITRQLQRQYAEPVLKDLNGNWYYRGRCFRRPRTV